MIPILILSSPGGVSGAVNNQASVACLIRSCRDTECLLQPRGCGSRLLLTRRTRKKNCKLKRTAAIVKEAWKALIANRSRGLVPLDRSRWAAARENDLGSSGQRDMLEAMNVVSHSFQAPRPGAFAKRSAFGVNHLMHLAGVKEATLVVGPARKTKKSRRGGGRGRRRGRVNKESAERRTSRCRASCHPV